MRKNLKAKIKESLSSVLPITAVVFVLALTIAPMNLGIFMLFLVGAVMLIVGMGLFTLGADTAMLPMGEQLGSNLTKSRKLPLILIVGFLIGVMITVAEPDLQVLARQVPTMPDMVIILTVALGVGVFLLISLLRIMLRVPLSYLLLGFYGVVFLLGIWIPSEYLAVAFDSGGVTTGPITVPFILALGVGVAAVRSGKTAQDDSFGLVALCSIGPILSVMVLSCLYPVSHVTPTVFTIPDVVDIPGLMRLFAEQIPHYAREVAIALAPIVIFFFLYQAIRIRLPRVQLIRIGVGVLYTYLGLVLFLTGVNVGFMPAGYYIGQMVAELDYNWVLIPIGMLIGYFVVSAEPAVHVLNKQVEELSGGAISKRSMQRSLSIGVALSLGLAMSRVLFHISIWWFLVPGYLIALVLTFFVPKMFTAIAFDSGGVASGPMTATFLLPFAMGACGAVGGNLLLDAFGIVAMVAMTPLVTIQIMGVIYQCKTSGGPKSDAPGSDAALAEEDFAEVIEL